MLWPKKNLYKEFDNEKKIIAARTTKSIFRRPSMLARLKWTDGSLEMWFLTSLITIIAGRKLSAVQWKTLPFLACVLFLIVCKFSCHMSSFVSLS